MKRHIIRAVLLLVTSAVILWFAPREADADHSCLGFKVPASAHQIAENRYQVGKGWEQVMKYYQKAYQGNDRIRKFMIISLPGVTAMHFKNLSDKGQWAGANVSRIKGKVYVFCFPKDGTK